MNDRLARRLQSSLAWPLLAGMLVTCLVFGAPRLSRAADDPPAATSPVANVTAIDGTLSVQRAGQPRWCDGYVRMPDYMRDRLRTDEKSIAALDLTVGGRVGISKGSEIEIVEGGEVQQADKAGAQAIVLHSGTLWAKFEHQQKPFQVRTQSALLDIRGTEFTVEATKEGATTLSVLEGQVAYSAVEEGKAQGTPALAGPGVQVLLAARRAPLVKIYEARQLRKRLEDVHPGLRNVFVQRLLGRTLARLQENRQAMEVVTDPNNFAADVTDRVNTGIGRLGIRVPRPAGARPPVNFATGLAPDRQDVPAAGLVFVWQPFRQCQRFVVMLSRDEHMAHLDWSAQVTANTVAYPRNGFPLVAGQKYFWRVVGLDAQGEPRGRAAQTYFTVSPDS